MPEADNADLVAFELACAHTSIIIKVIPPSVEWPATIHSQPLGLAQKKRNRQTAVDKGREKKHPSLLDEINEHETEEHFQRVTPVSPKVNVMGRIKSDKEQWLLSREEVQLSEQARERLGKILPLP